MKRTSIIFTLLAVFTLGCMDDLHNYHDCVQIETARCEFRDKCQSGFDVESCIFYYEEFCRTRKIGVDVTSSQVDSCIEDIETLGTPEQCVQLEQLEGQSEICVFSELASCREFLCIDDNDDDDENEDTETDTDTDSTQTSGLDPV